MKRIIALLISVICIIGMLCSCADKNDVELLDNSSDTSYENELINGYWSHQFSVSNTTSEQITPSPYIVGITFWSDGTGNILMSPYEQLDMQWEHHQTTENGIVYSIYIEDIEIAVALIDIEEYGTVLVITANDYTSYYSKS